MVFVPDNAADDLTRHTVRVSLVYYALACGLMLSGREGRTARLCWTLALAAFLVHLWFAFVWWHGGSHAAAVEHTRVRSGVGEGIWASHLFTLLWTLDVLWWWASPASRRARPAWVGRTLHAYLAFITFNGTVVYETGLIRWAGLAMFAGLAALWAWSATRGAYRPTHEPEASARPWQ
jgi:hypothetical protein